MKKANASFLVACLGLASLTTCFGQATPNDAFTNATVLAGDNVFFTGDLTGSTTDSDEVDGEPFLIGIGQVQHSVWWSWTASNSGPVTLAALSYSEDTLHSDGVEYETYIAVYSITNDSPHQTFALGSMWLNAAFHKMCMTFTATAGTTYQIQLADFSYTNSTMQVGFQPIATNAPVIFEQPADQTTAPGGSAFFPVLSDGIQPLSYQWYSNDVAIPGATFPMLALDNVGTNLAGAYTVVVSNATGVVTSQVANLKIVSSLAGPALNYIGQISNTFAFSLADESGSYWRIESSTDLVNWLPENSFPSTQVIMASSNAPTTYGSVAFCTNSLITLIVPANGAAKFLRARNYAAPNEICNNNLKKIRFAKELWVRHFSGFATIVRNEIPTDGELEPFGVNPDALSCPVGGAFSYNPETAIATPTCTVPGHVLEEPQ